MKRMEINGGGWRWMKRIWRWMKKYGEMNEWVRVKVRDRVRFKG